MQNTTKSQDTIELTAGPEDAGQRLDRWLAHRVEDMSRARIQALIHDGYVSDGATIREARTPVKPGVTYTVTLPPPKATTMLDRSAPARTICSASASTC